MLEYFLSFKHKSNISGDFHIIDDKKIFEVSAFPSKNNPVFLKGQNGKEFYIRGEASTRRIEDIEEIAHYCLDHWGR